jgi:hypothetical protein
MGITLAAYFGIRRMGRRGNAFSVSFVIVTLLKDLIEAFLMKQANAYET